MRKQGRYNVNKAPGSKEKQAGIRAVGVQRGKGNHQAPGRILPDMTEAAVRGQEEEVRTEEVRSSQSMSRVGLGSGFHSH